MRRGRSTHKMLPCDCQCPCQHEAKAAERLRQAACWPNVGLPARTNPCESMHLNAWTVKLLLQLVHTKQSVSLHVCHKIEVSDCCLFVFWTSAARKARMGRYSDVAAGKGIMNVGSLMTSAPTEMSNTSSSGPPRLDIPLPVESWTTVNKNKLFGHTLRDL